MERNEISNGCKRFFIKVFKFIRSPVARLRKILRKSNMRQMKIAVGVLIIFSCVATAISYYWYRLSFINTHGRKEKVAQSTQKYRIQGTPFRHIPLDEVYKDFRKDDEKEDADMFEIEQMHEARMVDTVGCKIPVKMVDYRKYIKNNTRRKSTCGKRAVFLRKIDGNTVHTFIRPNTIKRFMIHKGTHYNCCYQFILKTVWLGDEQKIIYSNCTNLEDNIKITLQSDFINVKCFEYAGNNKTYTIYDDMFAFTKKKNISTPNKSKCKTKYNVIMIGMDSMSLPRAVQNLPRTIHFFKNDFWISYRGYHKIADNTFPNLMAAFTGKNISTIAKKCSGNMDGCNNLMIWNSFKEDGYVTAYGEDYLQLPDTFTNEYKFRRPPTDHYMRPFFLKGEYRRKNSSFLCAGKVSSGQQILDYALDFATTYRRDSFFGIFWINSFSHDANSRPHDADKIFENFFNQLSYTGVLPNTFVIFFSDHGIRFGEQRFKVESYYDDRMPMFFMWPPPYFKGTRPYEIRSIAINQYRLVTPYDIYSTLLDIKQFSMCNNITDGPPEGCPNCHSTFEEVSENRTCQDVAIHEKWCSCHKLYPLPIQDSEGTKSVDVVVNYITSMVKTIKTQRCWGCMALSLRKIIRIHFYYDKDKVSLYYVVAFSMTPGNASYEATVLRKSHESYGNIIGPVSVITNYRGLGKCAINHRDRLFCVCQKIDNC